MFREEADARPIIDFLLYDESRTFRAILTVSKKYLLAEGAPLMLDGEFTVLGKLTAVLRDPDQEMQLLRGSIFRYLTPSATKAASDYMRKSRFLNLKMPELVVRGPALQLLPLSIYS